MKCELATDLIVEAVLNGLDSPQREELDRHLAGCAACADGLSEFESLWADLADADVPEPDAHRLREMAAALRQQAAAETASVRTRPFAGRPRRAWSRAAAALVFVAAGAAAGVAVERSRAAPAAVAELEGSRFLLLMRGVDSAVEADSSLTGAVGTWAGGLQSQQRMVDGAAMGREPGAWVGPTPADFGLTGSVALDGYMIITARDFADARAVASEAPHLVAGGSVELWPLR
ncbi:MAG: zf-HC2 domain-containing protein [Gemmatimonadota bacterium]